MDSSDSCPCIQILILQLLSQCFGFCISPVCKITGFSEYPYLKIGIRIGVAIQHSNTGFLGHCLYRIYIDPVRIFFVRRPLQHALYFFRCVLQKFFLLLLRIALTHNDNHKVFPVIPCLVDDMNRKCRCLFFLCVLCLICPRSIRKK